MAVNKKEKKTISVAEIARIAKVHKSTVSRALNNSSQVGEAVTRKVQKIARDKGYFKNMAAYNLRKQCSMLIDVVFPTYQYVTSGYYSNILHGISDVLSDTDYSVSLSNADKMTTLNRKVFERRIDGLIFLGDTYTEKQLKEFSTYQQPKVFITNFKKKSKYRAELNVMVDNKYGTVMLTEHFIKQERRQILFITGGREYQSSKERQAGFLDIADKYNIDYDIIEGDFARSVPYAYQLVKGVFKARIFPFDAVIGANDDIALGAAAAIAEKMGGIASHILIGGHDNTNVCSMLPYPILSVDNRTFEQGQQAARMLLAAINGDEIPKRQITITPYLPLKR